jgi:hypothetical protein
MGGSSRLDRWVAGRGRTVLIGIAVLAMLALPVANVFASHVFTDVPTSSPYHDAISAIANAGITGGCNQEGSKYCPKGLVTREQMAVFLDRIGNLSDEKGAVADALTLTGQLLFNDVEDFVLAGGAASECETSQNPPLPSVPDEIISYSIVHQLRDAPMPTDLVNVQILDDDQTDGTYMVCFRTLDNTNLTAGTYNTNFFISLTLGSGLFASDAGARSAYISRWRQAFKH